MEATFVIDGADDYLDRLRSVLCAPGGELARLDRVLAAEITLLAGRLRAPLAAALARLQPGAGDHLSGEYSTLRFREVWTHDSSGVAVALARDGRVYERGASGPWVCVGAGPADLTTRRARAAGTWRQRAAADPSEAEAWGRGDAYPDA